MKTTSCTFGYRINFRILQVIRDSPYILTLLLWGLCGRAYSAGVINLESIDAMRAVTSPNSDLVAIVKGYSLPNDGGGGLFYYDSTNTIGTNFGTIFAPFSGTGRWFRVYYPRLVSLRWFVGATDPANDISARFLDACTVAGSGGTLEITPGSYRVSNLVITNNNFTIIGTAPLAFDMSETANGARLIADSETRMMAVTSLIGGVRFENLAFWGRDTSTNCLYITAPDVTVRNCVFSSTTTVGIMAVNPHRLKIIACNVQNIPTGISLDAPAGSDEVMIRDSLIQYCSLYGVWIANDMDISTIESCSILHNGTGIYVHAGGRNLTIAENLISNNNTNGIVVRGWATGGTIRGNWIEDNGVGDTNNHHWGLWFLTNSVTTPFGEDMPHGWLIEGNRFSASPPRHGILVQGLRDSIFRNNLFQQYVVSNTAYFDGTNIVLTAGATNNMFINQLDELGRPFALATNLWLQGTGTTVHFQDTNGLNFNGQSLRLNATNVNNFRIQVGGNIGPDANGVSDIGSVTDRHNRIYANDFYPMNMSVGSVTFGGTGSLLTQDNANLFWDNTTKELATAKLKIGGGTQITKHLSSTISWDPASIADGAATSTNVTVTGAIVGDTVAVGFSTAVPALSILSGQVTSANTVSVTLFNKTGSNLDLGSGTLRADVWQH
jgi:hypothetical protein